MKKSNNDLLKITICDDSPLARKQLSSLFADRPVEIFYAVNGIEALQAIRSGQAELLFLDLNMPVMDGFQVLEKVNAHNLDTNIIVVSGDIQDRAQQKALDMGALAFVVKPLNTATIERLINQLPVLKSIPKQANTDQKTQTVPVTSKKEHLQEIANIATGKTAAVLGELLANFVHISIPKINTLTNSDIFMMLKGSEQHESVSSVIQGFVGGGIHGESVLIVDITSLPQISKILGFSSEIDSKLELDILIDLAGLLSGSFIKSFFSLLDIQYINQSIPTPIGTQDTLTHLTENPTHESAMAIEISYRIPEQNIECDLLILFTLDSIQSMLKRAEYYV